jgi:hypothetical protein
VWLHALLISSSDVLHCCIAAAAAATAAAAAAAARGVLPTLLGILPYAGLKFYVYQAMKNHYKAGSFSNISSSWDQAAGPLAQQQQQQQQAVPAALESSSIGSSNVAVAEAADCSLALTAASTLLSDGSSQQQHVGGQHQQQTLNDMQQQQQQPPQKLPVVATLVFGGLAGLVAQTVTYPLVSHLACGSLRSLSDAPAKQYKKGMAVHMIPASCAQCGRVAHGTRHAQTRSQGVRSLLSRCSTRALP